MFPDLLYFFWMLLQAFTAFSITVPAIFCLFYFIRRYRKKQQPAEDELHEEKDYAIIVFAFESSENVNALLQSLLQLNYTNYLVYVVGKYSSVANISLRNDKLVYLRTARNYYSQCLLHRFAIESFRRSHTHVVILDGNSVVDNNYLMSLNTFFHQGYQAVASRKTFQNHTGVKSVMQAATDLYRNFFTGEMMFTLGSSATLSCAGTAFTVSFYKQCLKKIKTDDIEFSAALQARIIQRGQQIAFASNAIVYSTAPVSNGEFAKHHAQRIHSWLVDLFFYCKTSAKGLLRGNANQLLYGVLAIRLPLPTSALIGLACLVVNARIHAAAASFWAGSLLLVPVYLVVAVKQLYKHDHESETEVLDEADSAESISMYQQEEEYSAMAQTV